MQLLTASLQMAFRKVRQLREETKTYCLNGDGIPVSLEDLHFAVQSLYGLKVEILKVAKGGTFSRGLVVRRLENDEQPTRIVLSGNQPSDWFRLAAAKELGHVVNDQEEDWSMDGAATVKDYFYETSTANDEPPARSVQSEMIAQYSAIELLYPFECRVHDQAQVGKTTTLGKLALHYKIPEVTVGRALHESYMEQTTRIWESLPQPLDLQKTGTK